MGPDFIIVLCTYKLTCTDEVQGQTNMPTVDLDACIPRQVQVSIQEE